MVFLPWLVTASTLIIVATIITFLSFFSVTIIRGFKYYLTFHRLRKVNFTLNWDFWGTRLKSSVTKPEGQFYLLVSSVSPVNSVSFVIEQP